MKKAVTAWTATLAVLFALVQCSSPYDDDWIKDKFREIDSKLSTLETNVNSLRSYENILKGGKMVKNVSDNGNGTFTITFTDNTSETITAGKGAKGDKGDKGEDGINGANGNNGKDGVTPEFKIEDGNWFVSYDKGATWSNLGSASSSESLFFQKVYVDGEELVLVLIDGTEVRLGLGDQEAAADLGYWLGNWTLGTGDYQFDVTITQGEGETVNLCWGDIVKIPFEYETASGNLLLKMPENRWIGGSADSDINYYLNLYDTGNKRINPDTGALLVTLSKVDDGTASCTPADETYNGFYARPYTTSTSSWGSSVFWFDLNGELVRKSGGEGGEGGEATLADWVGNWAKGSSVLAFTQDGDGIAVSFSGLGFSLAPKGDGSMGFTQPQYAWLGTDSSANNYYLYAYSGSTYVNTNDGDEILVATLSADKRSVTFAAPSGAGFDKLSIGIYSSASEWVDWFSSPSNLLGTYTRQ